METLSALAGTTTLETLASTDTSSTSSTTTSNLEEDKLEFLNLLLTQLENQNPLDPMDTDEYTQQLVSYSQLEQQMEMNETLESISTQLSQNALTDNMSYIGQNVEISTNIGIAQNNEVNWAYIIDGTASSTELTVVNEDGETIWSGEGETSTGVNELSLDLSELNVSDGDLLYLTVNAISSAGENLETDISTFATVDGVQSDSSTTYLTSGGLSYTLSDVLKITN